MCLYILNMCVCVCVVYVLVCVCVCVCVGVDQTFANEVSNERDKYQFIYGRDGAPGRDGRDGVTRTTAQGPPGFP